MATPFADQLHAELAVIQPEMGRLDAAPRGAQPVANLQANLQRMQEAGEIVNVGRNRWRLRERAGGGIASAPLAPSSTPPVVTSTTLLTSPTSPNR